MFLITTIRPPNTMPATTMTTDQWLAQVYGEAPAPVVQGVAPSEKFYNTYTRVGTPQDTQTYENILIRSANGLRQIDRLITQFKEEHDCSDMSAHYDKFFIPKHSGGMREINAPQHHLKYLMWQIKDILEKEFRVQYHDCAYAYFKGRSTKDAMRVHQANNSKWFLKLDLKDFFPRCTKEFILVQLCKLFPFHQLHEMSLIEAETWLNNLIDLCMLDGGLPQGTPLSPMLTNLCMLPFDYALSNAVPQFENQHFKYTRYADDILISSRQAFDPSKLSALVTEKLEEQDAPFRIKHEKTRYGSSAGRNWNLGLMLNKDNNITIGHKQKERLRAGINNFLRDFTNGILWSKIDLQRLIGNLSYLRNVEPDYCDYIIREYSTKYNLTWTTTISTILRD